MKKQTTGHILMVRPSYFGFNHETADNNAFQINDNTSPDQIRQSARNEYDALVSLLSDNDIQVMSYSEQPNSQLTDSIFPNNWFSTHSNGTIVTYPMFSLVRRKERKNDVLDLIKTKFLCDKHLRLENFENENRYLESTGSMILDRVNKKAYACKSIRTDSVVLDKFCEKLNYSKVLFDAKDESGQPIYHTNVIMSIGEKMAVLCVECIRDNNQKEEVLNSILSDEKEIIDISLDQVKCFSGNVLEVKGKQDTPFLIMSSKAYEAFLPDQLKIIDRYCQIIHSPIPTIEKYGGGGVRCMMAEIFLPQLTKTG